LIAGLVVAGFGLAPVYLAPASDYLLKNHGLLKTMQIFGIAFLVVVCGLAQLLVNPPAGHVPRSGSMSPAKPAVPDAGLGKILRQPIFWQLWVIYFIGAGAGLMVISSVSSMAKQTLQESAFVAVAVMAIGNAAGRIGAGVLSDRIGRRWTLALVLLLQAALMFIAIPVTGSRDGPKYAIVLLATFIGFNYGANLSIFPSFTKDLWGLKNFGVNYGVLFTAWGAGSLLSRISQMLKAQSGNFNSSFIVAGVLLAMGAALTLLLRSRPKVMGNAPESIPEAAATAPLE
jgi:nitrate/nitrite transporter NarK